MIQFKLPSFARWGAVLGLALAYSAALASSAALTGCGGEEKASSAATSFCTDGQKVCKGNYVATCASAGVSITQ